MDRINRIRKVVVFVVVAITCTISSAYSHDEIPVEEFNQLKNELIMIRRDMATMQQLLTEIHRKQVVPQAAAGSRKTESTELVVTEFDHVFGNSEASVVMVEYSEFQCPYCSRFNKQTLGALKRDYIDTGKLAFIPREFPLDFHAEAKAAAVFALCANKQGEYWAARELLFQHQRELGEDIYQQLTEEIGLDSAKIEQCRSDGAVADFIDTTMKNGKSLGVKGTPTVFIGSMKNGAVVNAKRVVGAQPVSVFNEIISSMLSE